MSRRKSGLGDALARAREDWWSSVWSRREPIDGVWQTIELLSIKYDTDWLAQRIVRVLVEDALRPPWSICDEDEETTEDLRNQFDALNRSDWQPEGHLFDGLVKGRLHGGAAIGIGFDSDPTLPAPEPDESATIKWLDVFRRDQLQGLGKEFDANSPNFGREKIFRVIGRHPRRGMVIDASRLILCEGRTFESELFLNAQEGYHFPWISVLQPVFKVIAAHGQSWEAISHLLREMSIMWFRMRGLIEGAASEDAKVLQARLDLMNRGKSIDRTLFLDAGTDKGSGEEVGRTAVSFADMPALMSEWAKLVSAAADMPVTRLFGMSPAGLNATGESDLTQWYDRVAVYDRTSVKPKIERILTHLAARPIEIKFAPLWEPSAKDGALIRLQNAQADQIWYNMGAVEGLEVSISRSKDDTLGIDIDATEKEKALKVQNADPNHQTGTPPAQKQAAVSGTPEDKGAVGKPASGSGAGPSVP